MQLVLDLLKMAVKSLQNQLTTTLPRCLNLSTSSIVLAASIMSEEVEVAPGSKWTGGVRDVELDCPLEPAWELCSDWAHWQRWWPGSPKCEVREGENRKPSCLRFVELVPGVCNYERLLQIDDGHHSMSYSLEQNHFEWTGYVAKAQFRATEDGKTKVDWSYEVDAVAGYTSDMLSMGMQVFYNTFLRDLEKAAQRLAKGLEPKDETTEDDAFQ